MRIGMKDLPEETPAQGSGFFRVGSDRTWGST